MPAPYLTDAQVAVINLARLTLKEVAENARGDDDQPSHRNVWIGELRHAAVNAENALFDVLNQANASNLASLTYEQLHMHPAPEPVEA